MSGNGRPPSPLPKGRAKKTRAAPQRRQGVERRAQWTPVQSLARCHAAAAVAALVAVMSDAEASPSARIAAAGSLLQWGFGKVPTATRAELLKAAENENAPQLIRLTWGESPATDAIGFGQAVES